MRSFLMFLVLSVMLASAAYGEAPPVIGDVVRPGVVRGPVLTTPRHSPDEAAEAQPVDGPQCGGDTVQLLEPGPPTLLGVLIEDPVTDDERVEVEMQMKRCWRGQAREADPFLILALYRYEETLGVPAHARGILGAIWCSEAVFRMHSSRIPTLPIRGDWEGGWAGAHGPFQLHRWAEDSDKCGLVSPPSCKKNDCFQLGGRDDLFASAHCWWQRVEARVESDFVKSLRCKDPYPLAEALVSNQGKYGHLGCKARSTHWVELKRWKGFRSAAMPEASR